ncbi:Aste57867_12115 [Aphanomyces stellatus]|uniref:Aste57867_12115 protein n=1 Tax=Aphanomyces stellatus TaxID=120398 RepID=A0A485KV56_9STRA|nr:hypothetical protein As57867_012070 [Aphanomyces stellatus]VFT88969.1 Aste57867_12115 [Aphanomyces stellatus]
MSDDPTTAAATSLQRMIEALDRRVEMLLKEMDTLPERICRRHEEAQSNGANGSSNPNITISLRAFTQAIVDAAIAPRSPDAPKTHATDLCTVDIAHADESQLHCEGTEMPQLCLQHTSEEYNTSDMPTKRMTDESTESNVDVTVYAPGTDQVELAAPTDESSAVVLPPVMAETNISTPLPVTEDVDMEIDETNDDAVACSNAMPVETDTSASEAVTNDRHKLEDMPTEPTSDLFPTNDARQDDDDGDHTDADSSNRPSLTEDACLAMDVLHATTDASASALVPVEAAPAKSHDPLPPLTTDTETTSPDVDDEPPLVSTVSLPSVPKSAPVRRMVSCDEMSTTSDAPTASSRFMAHSDPVYPAAAIVTTNNNDATTREKPMRLSPRSPPLVDIAASTMPVQVISGKYGRGRSFGPVVTMVAEPQPPIARPARLAAYEPLVRTSTAAKSKTASATAPMETKSAKKLPSLPRVMVVPSSASADDTTSSSSSSCPSNDPSPTTVDSTTSRHKKRKLPTSISPTDDDSDVAIKQEIIATAPRPSPTNARVPQTTLFEWPNGEFHRAPHDWQCPVSTTKTMWAYWFRGDNVNQIGPFRFLKANDVSASHSRRLLVQGRMVIDHLVRIAITNVLADSADHIADMPASQFMAVFDRSFDILLGKTQDGRLMRDGFQTIQSEKVVYYMYGSVYEIMTEREKKAKKARGSFIG